MMNKWPKLGRQNGHLSDRNWLEIARWPVVTTILDGMQAKRVLLHR